MLGVIKIVGWNCRGMNSPTATRVLLDVQRQWGPDVIFLSETHLNKTKAGKLRRKLKMDRVEVYESDGASGGLLMTWRSPMVIQNLSI